MSSLTPHRVVVLALDGVYPFELGVPDRIFGGVGAEYAVLTASATSQRRVVAHPDLVLELSHGPEALDTADTVIVPPFDMRRFDVDLPGDVRDALDRIRPGTRIASLCTGAFTLAAAGLLDGRRATTHWAHADEFRALFPQVSLDPDVLFVEDSGVLTSAGVASALDVCLHMVRTDHGSAVASRVARQCVTPPWREGGQAQYIEQPVPVSAGTSTEPTRAWALAHLDEPLTLDDLARHARTSPRTFARHFQDETGTSPGRWVTQQRLRHARQLLETTDLPVERVAAEVGFATGASLRQHFQTTLGVSPREYRVTFGSVRGTARDETA